MKILATILPDREQPAWADGPLSAPISKRGFEVPLFARGDLLGAISDPEARFPVDAHVQTVSWVGAPDRVPRVSSAILRDRPDLEWSLPVALVDLDRLGHERWGSWTEAIPHQYLAWQMLSEAGIGPSALYLTQGGMRAVYLLENPVPVGLWGWFERWLREEIVPLDWARLGLDSESPLDCKSPVGLFRLPYVRRDGVDLDPPRPLVDEGARLVAEVDPSTDVYATGSRARLSWSPSASPARVSDPDRYRRARLLALATAPYLPSAEDRGSSWPGPEIGPRPEAGFRETTRHLAGTAVAALAKHLPRDAVAEEAYALLAPLAEGCGHGEGCTHPHSTPHGERSEYLAALIRVFARDLPEGPLILHHPDEKTYLLREDGPGGTTWSPVPPAHLPEHIRRAHPDIEVTKPKATGDGVVNLTAPELYARHGRRFLHRTYSYFRPTHYDHETETLRLQAGPPLEIEPVRCPDVERWLEAAAGSPDALDRLLESLASARILRQPWAALWLPGPDGCGKQLVSAGLAAMFVGRTPVPYRDAISRFNSRLLDCPVIALHEGIRGGDSYLLRTLISEATHRIESKNKTTGTIEGFPRLCIDSNNHDPLGLASEDLSEEDERAVAKRINRVSFHQAAADLLCDRGNWRWTDRWIEAAGHGQGGGPGLLCGHLAYLEDTVAVDTARRFLGGPQEASGWVDDLTARSGLARDVVLYLALAATTWDESPGGGGEILAMAGGPGAGRVTVGQILRSAVHWGPREAWIRVAELRQVWGLFSQDAHRRPPGLDALTAEVNKLHRGQDRARWPVAGGSQQYRVRRVPLSRILDVAEAAGIGDHEAIKARMQAA